MEKSRSQSRSRTQDERQWREQQQRRTREHTAAGRERRTELAVERGVEDIDKDDQLRRAQTRAAQQQRVAQPSAQLAIHHTLAQQQQAARTVGQLAIRATQQGQPHQP